MCVVSMVGDFYTPKFEPYVPQVGIGVGAIQLLQHVSKAEFDQLRAEVLEMKQLLLKAKEIDEKTGQPDCEMETKIKVLKQIADVFKVDLSEVFK